MAPTPLHIGIVCCSAEGAALCYRTVCTEAPALLGRYAHPEVSMHGHSFACYQDCIDRDDWAGVAELMLASARKLEAAGARLLICPDNTIHRAFPHLAGRAPLPWLHIAEVVADAAVERGYRRLGLTGTRWLVQSEVYPEKLAPRGLALVRPDDEDREEISRIIMEELVNGRFTAEALRTFKAVIGRLENAGCDAVVLGCTEIPLLVDDTTSPLPTLDSTRLLARAALRRAIADAEAPSSRGA